MTYTFPYYDYLESTQKEMNLMKYYIEHIITASTQDISILKEVGMLSFMDTFTYPDLSNIQSSLTQSGEYTPEQIEEILAGLKTLPEYNRA